MDTESTTTGRSIRCAACGETARLAPNPYFGTGLSVHRHVVTCSHCGALGFAPQSDPEPSTETGPTQVTVGPWRRLATWLGGA
jgi:hypothetical protein